MKEKIALVCQRYGKEVNGGSEAECRLLAEKLAPLYDVTVYTTCAKNYVTWKNEYQPGTEIIDGVTVFRFATEKERSKGVFAKISAEMFSDPSYTDEQQRRWLEEQGPYCPALLETLFADRKRYRAIFFMTYMYYLSAVGLTMPFENAFLIPTAHDEAPIWLRWYDKVFADARGFLWQTEEEKAFAERRFPHIVGKPGAVGAVGIEIPSSAEKVPLQLCGVPYVVYAGRIEESKGCGAMFSWFRRYKRQYGGDLKLVLLGKPVMALPDDADILSLGFVSDATKYAVMRGARALLLFSKFESLSIVVLESMAMGRPVLVNGKCGVLRGHCLRSGAGLYFTNYYEFAAELQYLFAHDEIYRKMCKNGQEYVRKCYTWDVVFENVRQLISSLPPQA